MAFQGKAIQTKCIFTHGIPAIWEKTSELIAADRTFNPVPRIKHFQEMKKNMADFLKMLSRDLSDQEADDGFQNEPVGIKLYSTNYFQWLQS